MYFGKNKTNLVSFADSGLYRSARRLRNQALAMGVYNNIHVWDESNLDDKFIQKFGEKLSLSVRGYGYWVWKPQVILQALRGMNEGDLLHYCDVGCHLNRRGKSRLIEYFSITEKSLHGLIAFQGKPPEPPLLYDGRTLFDYPNSKWCKGDLIDYFSLRKREDILNQQMIGAGNIFIKKNKSSIAIISEWMDVMEKSFSLVDDSPSISSNLPGFIEHRHDQSIFSLICARKGVETISSYECYYPSLDIDKPDWNMLKRYPIHVKRSKNRGLIHKISRCIELMVKKFSK